MMFYIDFYIPVGLSWRPSLRPRDMSYGCWRCDVQVKTRYLILSQIIYCTVHALFTVKYMICVAEPKLFISGSDFVHLFGSGSSSSYSHILLLKTVL